MKKNVIIVMLLITTACSITFAYFKDYEAEKNAQIAVVAKEEAEKEKERADMQAQFALDRAAEARMAQTEAERVMQLYQECKAVQ
ncbi:hypothetical protein [Ekhidna sp.]|uniref:hypothetical protein n=1 Tax=Ekhidna sp. TaxID=2608089 RepID=UPI0032ED715C